MVALKDATGESAWSLSERFQEGWGQNCPGSSPWCRSWLSGRIPLGSLPHPALTVLQPLVLAVSQGKWFQGENAGSTWVYVRFHHRSGTAYSNYNYKIERRTNAPSGFNGLSHRILGSGSCLFAGLVASLEEVSWAAAPGTSEV